jgi:hypothetical protein
LGADVLARQRRDRRRELPALAAGLPVAAVELVLDVDDRHGAGAGPFDQAGDAREHDLALVGGRRREDGVLIVDDDEGGLHGEGSWR